MPKLPPGVLLILLFLLLMPNTGAASGTPLLPAETTSGSQSLLPYLEYFLDESASMDIEEISAPELSASFAPFSAEKLPAATGVLWLRFGIEQVAAGAKAPLQVLDMGPDIPGAAVLYAPAQNELAGTPEWREIIPARRDIILLPEAGAAPVTCYLRLEGLPGFWFSPTVRSPEDAATNWGSLARAAAILTLGVVLCLCLVRWVTERGQWRVWTALFTAVAFLQAIAGLPPQVGNPGLWGLCGILAPGIALMLLPHVARHLLRAREVSRAIDIQLFLLTLPGMACALLPLLPGWSWIDRWIELWPLCTLIFLPTALGAWLMGLAGSRRFLLACLVPPLFTAIGMGGVYFGVAPQVLASAPVWGIAVAAILLAATRAPDYAANEEEEESAPAASGNEPIITLDSPLASATPKTLDLDWHSGSADNEDVAAKLNSMNDPNLRLAMAGEEKPGPQPLFATRSFTSCEDALREPLDDLLRAGAALEKCSLAPAIRKSVEEMLSSARKMAGIVSGGPVGGVAAKDDRETTFNLQHLLRQAHDSVAPLAENSSIALAWYMPPHLPQLYRGSCGRLGEVLELLLESAIRATKSGTVQLSARRVPGSSDPGHLLFTVSDSGSGQPPAERSALALARAWELVGEHNGFITMESGEQGATIAFSLRFAPLDGEGKNAGGPTVAIMCENEGERKDITEKLQGLEARLVESASPQELLAAQSAMPAGMLIVRGEMASPAAADMLAEFVAKAHNAGYGVCKIMAVHSDNSQDRQLASSGFTHAIPEPLDAGELLATVRALLKVVENNRTVPAEEKNASPLFGPDSGASGARESEKATPAATRREGMPGDVEKPHNEGLRRETPREAPAEIAETVIGRQEVEDAPLSGGAEIAPEAPNTPDAPKAPEAQAAPRPGGEDEAVAGRDRARPDEILKEGEKAPEIAAASSGKEAGKAMPEEPGEPGAERAEKQPMRRFDENAAAPEKPDASENPAAAMPSPEGTEAARIRVEEAAEVIGEISPTDEMPAKDGREQATDSEPVAGSAPVPQAGGVQLEDAAEAFDEAEGKSAAEAAFAAALQAQPEMETAAEPTPKVDEAENRADILREFPENAGAAERGARSEQSGGAFGLDAVEWVGEPTPIVKNAPPSAGTGENSGAEEKSPQRELRPVKISLPEEGFVEWVGEPMPIGSDRTGTKKPGPETPPPSLPEAAKKEVKKEAEKTLPKLEEPAREHGNLLGDFVSRTISQVSATIEKLTRGTPEPERRPAGGQRASGAGGSGRAAPKAVRESGVASTAAPAGSSRQPLKPWGGKGGAETERQAREIDPAVFELVDGLDRSLDQAHKAFAVNNAYAVAEAAARISDDAQKFGLRHLSKLAQCVVRAGRAGDMGALRDILPDLDAAVERNRITLTRMK